MNIGIVSSCPFTLTHLKNSVGKTLEKQNIGVTDFHYFENIETAENALLNQTISTSVHFLDTLPTHRSPGLKIGAVLPRLTVGYTLCIAADYADATKILRLPENAILEIDTLLEAAALLDYRQDFSFLYRNKDQKANKSTEKAFLCPNYYFEIDKTLAERQDYIFINLDISEMPPPPAQGVIALQHALYDSDTEAILRQIHDRPTLLCCNIERKVQQILGDKVAQNRLGVYCKTDTYDNFHVSAAWANSADKAANFIQISQNTRHNLAENIINKIKNISSF